MKLVKEINKTNIENEISEKEVEEAFVKILKYIGEDPGREGLLETPKRVRKAFKEYFKGSLDLKETNEKVFDLANEVGYLKFTYLYLRVMFQKWPKIFFRTRKMKKWSYFFPADFLEKKISDLRKDFNIKILSPEERKMKKISWQRAIS